MSAPRTVDDGILIPVESCPACESREFEVLLNRDEVADERRWMEEFHRTRFCQERRACDLKDRADFTQSEDASVLRCGECGCLVRSPKPDSEALEERYRRDRYGRRTLDQLLEAELPVYRAKAGRFGAALPANSRVLEIGCFVGAFLIAARESGWRACGVDIGEETGAFCRSKGFDVADSLDRVDSRFEAVFIWNTFDQLACPDELLAKVAQKLRPGGLLAIRVPNGRFRALSGEAAKSKPQLRQRLRAVLAYNNCLTFPYLVGYTPAGLSRLVAKSGFSEISVQEDRVLPLANATTDESVRREEELYRRAVVRACRLLPDSWPWFQLNAMKS